MPHSAVITLQIARQTEIITVRDFLSDTAEKTKGRVTDLQLVFNRLTQYAENVAVDEVKNVNRSEHRKDIPLVAFFLEQRVDFTRGCLNALVVMRC